MKSTSMRSSMKAVRLDPVDTEIPMETIYNASDGERDASELVIRDVLIFSQPFWILSRVDLLKTGAGILWECLFLGTTLIGSPLINTFANVLLNQYGTSREQAAMGLAIAYNLWFYYAVHLAMFDKFGIDWSRSFGARHYHLTKLYFNQAVVVLFCTFALTTLPAYLLSEHLLTAVGTPPELAALTATVLKKLLWADAIETFAEGAKYFCMAQGHEEIFGKTALVPFVIAMVMAYWLVAVQQVGAAGWAYCKVAYEIVNFTIGATALVSLTHPETWGLVPISSVLTGLGKYFVDSFKYALGSYTEYLGYIISNYFVILTHDENQIAAFTIMESMEAVLYALGEAFATIMRTRMNILIGKQLNHIAKRFAIFFVWILVTFALMFTAVCFLIRDRITELYTGHNKDLACLFSNLILFFVFLGAPANIMLTSGAIAIKTVGKIELLVVLNTAMYILSNAGICWVLYSMGLMNSSVAYCTITAISCILVTVVFSISLTADWSLIKYEPENDNDNDNQSLLNIMAHTHYNISDR